jgi:hypothetical protein
MCSSGVAATVRSASTITAAPKIRNVGSMPSLGTASPAITLGAERAAYATT